MALLPTAKNCDISVKRNFQLISSKLGYNSSPAHANITLTDLTASTLIGADASKTLESVTIGTGLDYTRPTLSLSHLGIEALTDPGVDKIMFWDDSATACKWLGMGNSVVITNVTLDTIQDIRVTASPVFVGGTFSAVVTGVTPTAGAHFATKEYVDLAIGASSDYFLSDNDDPIIANYHILAETDTGEAASTEVTAAMGINDDQLMFSYITPAGVPGVTFLRSGIYVLHVHLAQTTGTRTTKSYWTLSKYTIGDAETVLITSEESSEIPDSMASFITHAILHSDAVINDTDRLVLKLYANVTGGGANSVITIYMEGTNDCHVTNLLPSEIWQDQGDVLDDLNVLGVVGADSEFLVGTGAGALAWESGATARASLGAPGNDTEVLFNDGGTFGADSAFTWNKTSNILTIEGATPATCALYLKKRGALYFYDDDNSHTISLQSPNAITTSQYYKLPVADGANGQLLTTDGSFNLSWSNGASAVAGNDEEIQYNASGVFGANVGLQYKYGDSPRKLQVSGNITIHPDAGAVGELRFHDAASSDYVGFKAPAVTGVTFVWELPAVDGTLNKVMGTNGGGVLIWRTHDEIAGFVANEHIDHTSVTLTASTGLTGGGDISANRTFDVDVGIADDKIMQVDDADAADDDYAKFTAAGLEGRSYSEVLGDLSGTAGAAFDFNSQALTSVGAIGCGAVTGTSTAAFEGASVTVGKASTTTGTIVLHDSNSANTITLTVPDISAGSLSFTLPPTDGDNTNVLQTNGSGVLTWAAAGAGASTWIALTDTDPANYTGQAGNTVVVNAGENGLEFGAAPGGAFTSKCSVYINNAQSIATGTWTKILLDTEDYDTDGEFDAAGNNRFQPNANGYYHVSWGVVIASLGDAKVFYTAIYKNGSIWKTGSAEKGGVNTITTGIGCDMYLLSTDFIELWIAHTGVGNKDVGSAANRYTFMDVHRFA